VRSVSANEVISSAQNSITGVSSMTIIASVFRQMDSPGGAFIRCGGIDVD
jgi:hypothetical protein